MKIKFHISDWFWLTYIVAYSIWLYKEDLIIGPLRYCVENTVTYANHTYAQDVFLGLKCMAAYCLIIIPYGYFFWVVAGRITQGK